MSKGWGGGEQGTIYNPAYITDGKLVKKSYYLIDGDIQ